MLYNQSDLIEFPDEILLLILFKLTPEKILASATVCIKFFELINQDNLWQEKILKYFPHMKDTLKQTALLQFKKEYLDRRKYIPVKMRQLFSFVIEDDHEHLEKHLTFDDLSYSDDLLSCILKYKNQKTLDITYNVINKHNEKNNNIMNLAYASSSTCYRSDGYSGSREDNVPLLHIAVLCNQSTSTITALLENDSDSLHKSIFWYQRPLDIAAKFNYFTLVEHLLSYNPDFITDAFTRAVEYGSYKSLHFLHQHLVKKQPDALTQKKLNDCLETAAINGHPITTKNLIEYGAEVNPVNYRHLPLFAAINHEHYDIAKILLEYGADPNKLFSSAKNSYPPIVEAAFASLDMIKLLLKFKANINTTGPSGTTALYVACTEGKEDIVEYLLNNGARVDLYRFPGKAKYSPLYMAARNGHVKVMKLLIEHGSDINHVSYEGKTALHCSALSNEPEAVKVLLENGANINALYKGKTALDIAKEKNHDSIIKLLEDYQKRRTCFLQKNKVSNHVKLGVLYNNNRNLRNAEMLTSIPRLSLI